jgi:hypothetical protein
LDTDPIVVELQLNLIMAKVVADPVRAYLDADPPVEELVKVPSLGN